MTISERIAAGRRERRVLTRVSRAAWRWIAPMFVTTSQPAGGSETVTTVA